MRGFNLLFTENKISNFMTPSSSSRENLKKSLGGKDVTDVVAHHIYADTPENMPVRAAHVRAVMAKHGIANRPLWNTEAGYWPTTPDSRLTKKWPRDEQGLAGYIARMLIMGAASGLDRFYWYSWEQTMLRHKEREQSVSAITAYSQTLRWAADSFHSIAELLNS